MIVTSAPAPPFVMWRTADSPLLQSSDMEWNPIEEAWISKEPMPPDAIMVSVNRIPIPRGSGQLTFHPGIRFSEGP